jgi:hypothetical protein
MSKSRKQKQPREEPQPGKPLDERITGALVLFLVTLSCYWMPMTSDATSILWDAADYYRVVQNYLSEELHAGRIPFWSPYPWSGYPFLADPQVGAWYPLNWPFFLIGVSPHVLVAEHWLHAFLACLGAYFLTRHLLNHQWAAILAGLAYGLSGYFTGHSSHTTMLQGAAWMPWLLYLFLRTQYVYAALAAAMMILAGHFQTILYSFTALGLFAIARGVRTLPAVLAIGASGTFIAAIGVLPGLELTGQSIRASLTGVTHTEGMVTPASLLTLIYPNYYGVLTNQYTGPVDITQFYFYAGILVLPLAVAGIARTPAIRWTGLLLIVPPVWFALGHAAGLYRLVALLPGFSSVRAPVNIWFAVALGLAVSAAAGLLWAANHWRVPWLPIAAVAFSAADLWYWNSAENPLAYARDSYQNLYGAKEAAFRANITANLPPLTRFQAPEHMAAFGPMSNFLSSRTETTYGYGPLTLSRYQDYVSAMEANPKLRNGLNVSLYLDRAAGGVVRNPDALPRATFPGELVPVKSVQESRAALVTLDQARQALVPPSFVTTQDPAARAEVTHAAPGEYRIRYKAASPSVLRIGSAWFPGWSARVDGRELPVEPVDHALMGVVVPAGEKEVTLAYRSTYFKLGAAISLLSLIAAGIPILKLGKAKVTPSA